TNDAADCAAYYEPFRSDRARNPARLADYDFGTTDVSLDLPINLQSSFAHDPKTLANDLQIIADHRLGAGLQWALARLLLCVTAPGAGGRSRFERMGLCGRAARKHGSPWAGGRR